MRRDTLNPGVGGEGGWRKGGTVEEGEVEGERGWRGRGGGGGEGEGVGNRKGEGKKESIFNY